MLKTTTTTTATTTLIRCTAAATRSIPLQQPTSIARAAAAPMKTTTTCSAFSTARPCTTTPALSAPQPPRRTSPSALLCRAAAAASPFRTHTTTTTTTTATTTTSPTPSSPSNDALPLDWNRFFALRKTRRLWQLCFSGAAAVAGIAGGMTALSSGALEPVVSQVPLDPLVTMGLITVAFGGLGWLAGPSLGSALFNATAGRRWRAQMASMESQFFARIRKHRVDPTAGSMGNPVPDFYGEKISSVKGYRQWLKDQRAFNKKKTTFV